MTWLQGCRGSTLGPRLSFRVLTSRARYLLRCAVLLVVVLRVFTQNPCASAHSARTCSSRVYAMHCT